MIDNFVIFHVPHTSDVIPKDSNIILDEYELRRELYYNTDWFLTSLISDDMPNNMVKISEVSRLFVDVEKLPDEEEEDFKYGRGMVYIKTFEGNILREIGKTPIQDNYYWKHQKSMINYISFSESLFDKTYVIDLHSFDEYYVSFFSDETDFPDICLGVNETNCDYELLNKTKEMFEKEGYKVKINSPFKGSYLPKCFEGSSSIFTMMIEINKKLYLTHNNYKPIKTNGFIKLSKDFKKIMSTIFS